MTDTTIHDDQTPGGRPATEQEITALLGGITAADGTNYLDIYRQADDPRTTRIPLDTV